MYLNLGQTREFSQTGGGGSTLANPDGADNAGGVGGANGQVFPMGSYPKGNINLNLMSSGSKHWTTIAIPHTYIGSSWPIRVRPSKYYLWREIDYR